MKKELSKEYTVKSNKITADGIISFKQADKSVLIVKIKSGTQKAGEVTIVVATTADKLTDKEVKEKIDVMFKAKDDKKIASTEKIASVSVSVSVTIAKKIASTEKVILSTVKINLTPTNDTTVDEVIRALKTVKGLEKIETSDVDFSKIEAIDIKEGSVTITAKSTSKLVTGSKSWKIDELGIDKLSN
ncbi:hypothetical protein [Spiroplasma endosymbiont of Atherix ibis]|uniref:hypothetical protein n=1 Tax=Spiroplasma endosymbiont of Atherix ibis TaxID=3066291 RepID=UPI0030CB5455